MNRLSTSERATVIGALVEGNSIASIVRMTRIAKTTILRLIVQFADVCEAFHDERVVNLKSTRIECDELWAFCHCKKRNIRPELKGTGGIGDVWTWTGIDPVSKLIVNWHVGNREQRDANDFMVGLAHRFVEPIHVTTDGLHCYWNAIISGMGEACHSYAQCVKIYKDNYSNHRDGKYSPGECTGVEVKIKFGDPDPREISTSIIERHNLSVRMGVRRYTRLTNAHSKKFANHVAMTSIFMTCYNWCRVHQTSRQTPAMAAGLTNKVWQLSDLLAFC